MYTKVSIPKASAGAGAPLPKNPDIILIDVDDVTAEPTRSHGDTALSGDFTLKQGAKAVKIYATPTMIAPGFEVSGEADAKGFTKKLEFTHPGDDKAVNDFIEANVNKGLIALVGNCDNGTRKVYGSKCNPLYLGVEPTLNNEATNHKMTLQQAMADAFLPGIYTGADVPVADTASGDGDSDGESD